MRVRNDLIIDSFDYGTTGSVIGERENQVKDFSDIVEYIRKIQEMIFCNRERWLQTEVEEDISMEEWLFLGSGTGSADLRALLLDIYDKDLSECGGEYNESLYISLGEWGNACSTERDYREARRRILCTLRRPDEYFAFMRSCFLNSIFSEQVESELKKIKDFGLRTVEITRNLSVLNDEAVDLYFQYRTNLKEAMRIIGNKLKECSPDPKHAAELVFTFQYTDKIAGRSVTRTKEIECSPHTKLIHRGSDLRIYFYWCDEDVGGGEKVLIGRIGRHPW